MKSLIILIALIGLSLANKFPLRRDASRRDRLMREGKWAEAFQRRQSGRLGRLNGHSAPEIDFDDVVYVTDITIGTPPQPFVVDMDTGSADLWVPTVECESKACKTHHNFDGSKSTTYKKEGKSFSIKYGTGSCSGYTVTDNVCVSDVCVNNGFGAATTVANFFTNEPLDGIFGLAFQNLAETKFKPPVQTMIDEGLLANPWFTVFLNQTYGENVTGGLLTLGDYDNDHCSKNVDWIPLTKALYWQVTLDALKVGTNELHHDEAVIFSSKGGNAGAEAISDTGTSLIAGPRAEIKELCEKLGGKFDPKEGVYIVPCDTIATLPPVILTIKGKDYPLSPHNYVDRMGEPDNRCFLGFQAFFGIGIKWILGDPFIREYCQVYDMNAKRLGLAKALV